MDFLLSLLIWWAVFTVGIKVSSGLLRGFQVATWGDAAVVAIIFGVLNALVGWLLFTVIGIATLGVGFLLAFITRWVVMALLLKVTDALSRRLTITSFGSAFIAAAVISIIGMVAEWLLAMT